MSGFFRSVGVQLSLALLLVVAVVLGIVYLSVVPSLRDRAINTRVDQMERIVAKIRPSVDEATPFKPGFATAASEENGGAQVALMERPAPQGEVSPFLFSGEFGARLAADPVATQALDRRGATHGHVTNG